MVGPRLYYSGSDFDIVMDDRSMYQEKLILIIDELSQRAIEQLAQTLLKIITKRHYDKVICKGRALSFNCYFLTNTDSYTFS